MKKILLSSDCNGNFELLFSKVSQLSQKTKFDLMFLVGNVCTIEGAKQFSMICKGEINVPIPTYFITSGPMAKILNLAHPNGCQIAKNFHFLGQKGVKNVEGLNVCYFNGVSWEKTFPQNSYKGQHYDTADICQTITLNNHKPVDILLTNEWPTQIASAHQSTTQSLHQTCTKSTLVSLISYHMSPKYHIVGSGKTFYRMEPFKTKGSYTHFINVAQMVRNNLKDKYLLAIQTVPESLNPQEEIIANSVESPFDAKVYGDMLGKIAGMNGGEEGRQTGFVNEEKRLSFKESLRIRQEKKENDSNNYVNENSYVFFDGVPKDARTDDIHEFLQRWGEVVKLQVFKEHKGGYKSGIAKFSTLQQTKNCLSDSGKYSLYQSRIRFKPKNIEQKYRNEDCWFCEKNEKFDRSLLVSKGKYCMICLDKGPISEYHLQIVPLNHVDTLGKLESVQIEEIQLIKKNLKSYFTQQNYETIITQRYIKLSAQISHTLIQFIAIKETRPIIHKFYQINQDQRLNFNKIPDESNFKRKSEFFIKFQVNGQVFIKEIFGKERVEIDLVRKLVCQVINKPAKVNWRSCERTQAELQKDRKNVENVLKECHFVVGE